jgi:hypothetical protein
VTYCVAKKVTNLVTDQLHNQVTIWLLSTEMFCKEGKDGGGGAFIIIQGILKVKITSSLCLNNHCAMNTYGGVEV